MTSDNDAARRVAAETDGILWSTTPQVYRTARVSWCARRSLPSTNWCPVSFRRASRCASSRRSSRRLSPRSSPSPSDRNPRRRRIRPVTATTVAPTAAASAARPVPVARAYRFELVKQLAQWRVRLLILACWIGPAIAVIVVSGQSTLPSDTLFGREMHATGWAGALVVLSFAGSWFFPLLTSVVAGDVFSAEDRLGTWRHLLVAVRSPRRIFAAKALASLTVLAMCVPGLAVSGIVGGLVVGSRRADRSRRPPAGAAGRRREAPARLALRARPDPRLRRDRAARVRHLRAVPVRPAAARLRRARHAAGVPGAADAGRRPRGAAQLRVPLMERPVHQPAAARPAHRRRRREPGVGRRRDRAGVPCSSCGATSPAWRTTARCGARSPSASLPLLAVWALSAGVVAAATGATGSGIDAGEAAAVARDVVRPPLPGAEPGGVPPERHARRSCGPRRPAPRGPAWSPRTGQETTGAAPSPGISPASTTRSDRPSTSLTSTRTGGTSPTATDRTK